MIEYNLIAFVASFVLAAIISPLALKIFKKVKAKQTVLHYVTEHESKNGTPTMGGLIFIFSTIFVSIFFIKDDVVLSLISLAVMFSYALLGFLDDFLKVFFKQNLGLRAYQKIIGQVGISLVVAIFCYNSDLVGTSLIIPFTTQYIDIGIFIIPFIMFIFIALVNSVNLIDGLDGLASGVSFVCILAFACVLMIYSTNLTSTQLIEQNNLIVLCFAFAGSLMAYFMINCFPAKVFMGDTGSLAIGGFITIIAVLSKLALYIPVLGFVYVVTAASDVIQVLHFKRTKKRVFLMAPLHHHFQKKGVNENRIVTIYIIITMLICVLSVALILMFGGF